MSPSAPSQTGSDVVLAEIVEDFTNRVQAGESVDIESYVQKHPEHAERLRQLLPALALLDDLGRSLSRSAAGAVSESGEATLSGVLGDFRIVRAVGKGGMGIVYEAEQLSLRRRVALKVLPFAATMDARHLQRFHNEAQAAACLHHTNIVPVFFVGCERGVHFYAMQFIDGQPLSELIREMRQREKKTPTAAGGEATIAYQTPADAIAITPSPAAAITPLTGEGRRGRDYFRKVAELGVQAAEALDHAHQLGIVHRDIKPGNLLLDGRGNLWITDFGLAHMQHSEASLTVTGQAVGTPRYMSPEQALAKRVPIDHRTDVYSLGTTLYELLTLRPAFVSEDRQELLRQIAFEDPAQPRRLERANPAELEIIVLKAMEKRPQDRYATALELADDLRRWLLDQPIRARRPSWVQVGRKWVRRHQSAVWASVAVMILAVVVLAVSTGLISAAYQAEMKHRKFAEEAEKREAEQRRTAEGERDTKANHLYIADMQRAQQAWEAANVERCLALLEAHRPGEADRTDRRGWEWYYLQGLCHSELCTLDTGYYSEVQSMAWNPDSRHLAVAGQVEQSIQIWDVTTGQKQVIRPGNTTSRLRYLAWDPDGQRLAWADTPNRMIRVWDIRMGRESLALSAALTTKSERTVTWSPDGKKLAAYNFRSITVWDASTGQILQSLPEEGGWVRWLTWSRDGKHLAGLANGGQNSIRSFVRIWDLATGKPHRSLRLDDQSAPWPYEMGSWSPDWTRVARWGRNGIKIRDGITGTEVLTLPGRASLAWSPDGQRLAAPSAVQRHAIKVWDTATGKEVFSLRGHSGEGHWPKLVAWSPDGKRLASSCGGLIKVWDAVQEQEHRVLGSHTQQVRAISWSPNGNQLATAGEDGMIQIWEKDAAKSTRSVQSGQRVLSLAWNADGQRLTSGAFEDTVQVWEASTGKNLFAIKWDRRPGTTYRAGILSWSPDGRRLAVTATDGTIRILDAMTRQELPDCKSWALGTMPWPGVRMVHG